MLSFNLEGEEVKRGLNYFLGAGLDWTQLHLLVDGFLFQAPVSYYASTKSDLSPGYLETDVPNLVRPVEPNCLNCHARGVRARSGTVNGYEQPPFTEAGVSCERCHDKAETHMTAARAGKRIKPEPVGAETCAQCHLPGAVTIGSSVFVWDGLDQQASVNGHFEQLALSRCARASGGKLWCGSCHDPHGRTNVSANFNQRCTGCHEGKPGKLCAATNRTSDDCVACHMPRTSAATVQHAALTDHTIPSRPQPARPSVDVPRDAKLKLFGGGEASPRDLGLAYASIALTQNNDVWQNRAVTLLEKAPPDAKVLTQLAQLVERRGDQQRACGLYNRAVAADAGSGAASVNLGICRASSGDLKEALRLWEDAISRNPGLEAARLNLAVALYRTGNADAARSTLTEGLRFNPVSLKARSMLKQLTP